MIRWLLAGAVMLAAMTVPHQVIPIAIVGGFIYLGVRLSR